MKWTDEQSQDVMDGLRSARGKQSFFLPWFASPHSVLSEEGTVAEGESLSMSHQCPPLGATGLRRPSPPKHKRAFVTGEVEGSVIFGTSSTAAEKVQLGQPDVLQSGHL